MPATATHVRAKVSEGEQPVEVDGNGVGVVDALYNGLLDRYAREYQSLKTIQIVELPARRRHGAARRRRPVSTPSARSRSRSRTPRVRYFSFTDASRSVTTSSARAVIACVQYFVNAERAFLTLYNARRDAIAARSRGSGLALHRGDGRGRGEHELRRSDREHPQRAVVALLRRALASAACPRGRARGIA